jgi:hypothetical protein
MCHDWDASDPVCMVRQCYLLMIVSATEIVNDVDNSNGHHEYPNFC